MFRQSILCPKNYKWAYYREDWSVQLSHGLSCVDPTAEAVRREKARMEGHIVQKLEDEKPENDVSLDVDAWGREVALLILASFFTEILNSNNREILCRLKEP